MEYEHGWREVEEGVVGGSVGCRIAAAAVGLGSKGWSWGREGSTVAVGSEGCMPANQPLGWGAWARWEGGPPEHHCGSRGRPAGEPMQLGEGPHALLVAAGRCPVLTFCPPHNTASLHGNGSAGLVEPGCLAWVVPGWGYP